MKIEHKDKKFTLYDDQKEVGYVVYEIIDNVMYINGTVVDPEYRGQGLAKDIVLETVKYARKNQIQVIPKCSYVVDMFDKGGFEDIDAR